jgi:phosphoribosylformylglycinamidine synthase
MSDTQTVQQAPAAPVLDTVEHAAGTPDVEQPWAELGLKPDEYANIREIVGRRPTSAELAMYSVMWSEHCIEEGYGPSTDGLRFFTSVLRQAVSA